jgi:alcohol dehydrogenase class IV
MALTARTAIQGIRDATKLLADTKANVLVSCGGGSPIDAAKAIANQYRQDTGASSVLPHIAIPTTLSAAEFTACVSVGRRISVADVGRQDGRLHQ